MASRRELQEAFAQKVADGVTPLQAYDEAGYKSPQNARTRSERLLITLAPRIEEIRQKRIDELRDPSQIIARLLALAETAAKDTSPQGLNITRALLAEAGKLKAKVADPKPLRLPEGDGAPWADEPEVEPPLETAAWIARYGLKDA